MAVLGTVPARRVRASRYRFNKRWTPYLFLLPAILLELLVHVGPMLLGIGMSLLKLTEFSLRDWTEAPFAGLANYRVALDFGSAGGAALLHSFLVTVGFAVLVVAIAWLLGTVAALLMQGTVRARGVLRALFLTPYALPAYAAVITWSFMFQRDNGMINHVLVDDLGLSASRPFWLIGGNSFAAVVIVSAWRLWPFAFLVVMAGLQNVPTDVYEAAAIDGVGYFQQIRRITLPMLWPINQVLVLVLFLWSFNDFNTPYVLFGKSAPQQADLITMHIYSSSFGSLQFGLGSAMSVLLLLFLLVVTAGYLLLGRRAQHDR
jgi:multiple sugar transport system permease protein